MSKSPITCHVLDASVGKPAAGVAVSLECLVLEDTPADGQTLLELPHTLAQGETDKDGRCSTLLAPDFRLSPGVYKMVFKTGPYFAASNTAHFHPYVEIVFNYTDPSQHHHIPLLVSPFSYTTYRGS